MIEKEFTIVLYADRKTDEKGVVQAWFDTALEGTSSKCPPDLFTTDKVPNDCAEIQKCILEYVK